MESPDLIAQLLANIPNDMKTPDDPLILDIVLDGGAFNGSYLVGALQFLKAMESANWAKVNRISGISVGTICAVLYYYDALAEFAELYKKLYKQVKHKHNFDQIDYLQHTLREIIAQSNKQLPNNVIYIGYWNIETREKTVCYTYKTTDCLIDAVIRSMFLPFFINGKMLHEHKYVDGFVPYIFPFLSETSPKCQILHLNLLGTDKLLDTFRVKNEITNIHRVLAGTLDIYHFFVKSRPTQLCKYITKSDVVFTLSPSFEYFRWKALFMFEFVIILAITCLYTLTKCAKYMKKNCETSAWFYYGHIFAKLFSKIFKECTKTAVKILCF